MPLQPGAEPFRADGDLGVGVVVSHGFTGSPRSMRPWAEHLADAGLSVRLPRLPGHGTSWQELNRTRWDDWYGEVERAFDELKQTCETVFAMGLSMGGTLVLRLAEERGSDVAGIVLVNPSVLTLRKDAKIVPFLRWMVPSVKAIGDDIKADGVTEGAYTRTPVKAFYQLTQLWRLVRADLGKVDQPLLLLHSREDHVVEAQNAAEILAEVSSTDVQEVVLDDSYHVATLDNDAPTIFARSLEFVRARSASPAAG